MEFEKQTDVKSRDQFIRQVASNIKDSFEDGSDEAYIFGLSGKWGEGKTTFLNSLEKQLTTDEELLTTNIRVIKINPWKYADDKISFLRVFLKKINDVTPYIEFIEKDHVNLKPIYRVWRWSTKWFRDRKLRPLYDDVSRNRVNYSMLILALVSVGIVIGVYNTVLSNDVKASIAANKWFITALIVPFVLAAGQALITSQKSNHALTTLDSFDELMLKITGNLHYHYYWLLRKSWPRKQRTQILVFVDDLDRVTGSKAIEVLDNLRTFFDNSSFAFLVAGDHTVIERHLGKELLPDSNDMAERNEEGRRFLKKIFNVYWRLPLPIAPEVDNFIDDRVLKYKTDDGRLLLTRVGRILGNQTRRDIFKKQLAYYFNNNFRNMLRFVEKVVFSFDVIDAQLDNDEISDEKKAYFNDMKRHPLHVVRILLLEEIANPFYEVALSDTSIFKEMEKMAAIGEDLRLDGELEKYEKMDKLSSDQKVLLWHLLKDTPRFFDETGVKVLSFIPYFHLSSDSSFGDERGLSPKEFVERLKDTDPAGLKDIIENLGNDQMQATIKEVLGEVEDSPENEAKLLLSLYQGMLLVEQKFSVQNEVLALIAPSVIAKSIETSEDATLRNSLLTVYTSWLQHIKASIHPFEFAKSLTADDINSLANDDGLSLELSMIVVGWLVNNIEGDPSIALSTFGKVLNITHKDALAGYLAPAKDNLVKVYLNSNNETERNLSIELISDYIGKEAMDELRVKIKDLLKADDQAMWNRSDENVRHNLFSFDELDEILVESFTAISDYSSLRARMVFVSDKLRNKDLLWTLLVRDKMDLITDSFVSFVGQQRYLAALYPNEHHAKSIFDAVYKSLKDQPQEYSALQNFNRSHFYFAQLNILPNRVSIAARLRSKSINPNIKMQLERIANSEWPKA